MKSRNFFITGAVFIVLASLFSACNLFAKKESVAVQSIVVTGDSAVGVDSSITLKAKVLPENASNSW